MKRNQQVHLPKDIKDRNKLIEQIEKQLQEIKGQEGRQKDQQILKLRLKLIGDCDDLSVIRIEHLEQIFKHYCTHIFKIGKHMTFERLEYEKVHLTLDRLCVFLKDFGLTSANIEGHQEEVLDKQQIVRYFKRHSSNCRDLSFEEFVSCIQKLSIIYYDEKENFKQKRVKQIEERDKRIAQYKKRLKEKEKQKQKLRLQRQGRSGQVRKSEEDAEKADEEQKGENDDLVKNMMENDDIEDPDEQMKKQMQGGNKDSQVKEKKKKGSKLKKPEQKNSQIEGETRRLYKLTIEEKIQYYYQLFGVDNVHDFRKRMSELGLPLFKNEKPKKSVSTKTSNQINVIIQEEKDNEQKRRLIELREKLTMKKERDKNLHSPLMSKEDYEERKRRREEKQTQLMREVAASRANSRVVPSISKKKVDLTEKQVSLDMLNHISFEDLKQRFNPAKYFSVDDSDPIFMNEYGPQLSKAARKPHSNFKNKDKTESTFDFKKRNSSNVVDDFKKRAYEMKAKQFSKDAEMSRFANKFKYDPKNHF